MHQFDLNNRTAIITGGAQGFGLAVTERFIEAGAKPHHNHGHPLSFLSALFVLLAFSNLLQSTTVHIELINC